MVLFLTDVDVICAHQLAKKQSRGDLKTRSEVKKKI